jgi:class 3 adenylate cyclase
VAGTDRPGEVRAVAVHAAARIVALARAGEVLVSATTQDLLAGTDLAFEDRGRHHLKGLSGERQLFSADEPAAGAVRSTTG